MVLIHRGLGPRAKRAGYDDSPLPHLLRGANPQN